MINSLKIQNFQSHKNSTLQFHEGVNIIVGATDSGKSAIIRTLRYVFYNRPLGNAFRSNWGGKTSVSVTFDDATTVTRELDASENLYKLDDQVFKAFKTDVPKEVQEVINISDINLQQQHDSVFLLTQTPGEIARHFNRIAKLDKIDTGLSNVKRWINEINSTLKFKQEELTKAKEKQQQFEYLEKFESEVEGLELKEKTLSQMRTASKQLSSILSKINCIDEDLEENAVTLELEEPLNNLLDLIDDKNLKIAEKNKIAKIVQNLNDIDLAIEEDQILISIEPDLANLQKKYVELKEKESAYSKLQYLCKRIENADKQIAFSEKTYNQLHEQFEENMPDVCPLCNSKIK